MANRYWVGGAGTWDASSTANWSATSGGATGASAPTSADNVYFDANSGSGTVVTASGAVCLNIANIINAAITIQLNADLTMTGGVFLSAGTLDLNNYVLTTDIISSTSTTARTLAFGTTGKAVITRTVTVTYAVDLYNATTGTTLTGNPVFDFTGNFSGNNGIRQPSASSINIDVNVKAGTGTFNLGSGFFAKNVDFTGFSGTWANGTHGLYGGLTLSSTMTVAAGTGVLSFLATSDTQSFTTNGVTFDRPITKNGAGTLQLQDNLTMGSTRTFTLTAGTLDLVSRTLSTGLFSSSNSNVRSIAFGTGNITVTGNSATVFTTGTVTNFSYTGTPNINFTYAGAVGTRTIGLQTVDSSEAKVFNFNITAGSDIVSLFGTAGAAKNINFTGFTGTISIPSSKTIYGSWNSGNATAITGVSPVTFAATSGTQQITTAGLTFDFSLTFNGVGGTFAFQDALTQGSTRNFTITNGTVQLKNGVTSTVGNFVANNSNVKFLQSTTPGSQATLSQASGTVNVVDLTIRDINAVGGASWNAYTDFENTDAGNNDGWNFSLSPPYSTAELPVTLRPFTQPRRF